MIGLGTIRTRVQNLVGSHSSILVTEIDQIIQADHVTILNDNTWSERKTQGTITTVGPYTTGTVSIVNAAVTGLGTVFTQAMVNRWFRFGTQVQFFKITAVADATHLTIEQAVPEGSNGPGVYAIFQHVYTLPTDCERITSIVHQQRLREASYEDFDRLDPYRSTTATWPEAYCFREQDSAGTRQIELWPTPSTGVLLRMNYLRANTLSDARGGWPLYRTDVLVWKAAASCAYLLYAKTGDQAWIDLAKEYIAQYDKSLQGARLDDLSKNSPAHRIRDVVYTPWGTAGPYYDRDNLYDGF